MKNPLLKISFDSAVVSLIQVFMIISWIAGSVLAKGFWSTFISIVFPFWSWYLVIEKIMIHYNLI